VLRPFTHAERAAFIQAATAVRERNDAELGDLLLRVADGDDAALIQARDRLGTLGGLEYAERLRWILESAEQSEKTPPPRPL
jgi:hypothetical protein